MSDEHYNDIRERLVRIETAFNERVRPGDAQKCGAHEIKIATMEKAVTTLRDEVTVLTRHFATYAGGLAVIVFLATAAATLLTKWLTK